MDGANIRKIFLIIIVAIAAILVALAFLSRKPSVPISQFQAGNNTAPLATRGDIPENIAVPGATSSVPANVAKPDFVFPISPKSKNIFRSFTMTVQNNKFSPDTFIVNKGDKVQILATAVDRGYDFYQPDYNLSGDLPLGKSRSINFPAGLTGTFTFYCVSCGGPAEGPTGKIIITNE